MGQQGREPMGEEVPAHGDGDGHQQAAHAGEDELIPHPLEEPGIGRRQWPGPYGHRDHAQGMEAPVERGHGEGVAHPGDGEGRGEIAGHQDAGGDHEDRLEAHGGRQAHEQAHGHPAGDGLRMAAQAAGDLQHPLQAGMAGQPAVALAPQGAEGNGRNKKF